MYRQKWSSLTAQQIFAIETAILKSGKNFSEIANEYCVFLDDVKKYAVSLGMSGLDGPIEVQNPVRTLPSMPERKAGKGVRIGKEEKDRIKNILLTFQDKKWEGFNRTLFCESQHIAYSTLMRFASEFNIIIPQTRCIKSEANSATVPTNKDSNKISANGLIEFDPNYSSRVISAKISDNFNLSGINYSIYQGDPDKIEDLETPMKKFFERNVGKVDTLQIYTKGELKAKIKIISLLCKYCIFNKINLVYVEGIKKETLINDFGIKLEGSLKTAVEYTRGLKKYIYGTSFDNLLKATTVYSCVVYYTESDRKEIILTDSYKNALQYVLDQQLSMENNFLRCTMYINKAEGDASTQLLYIDTKSR